MIIKMIFIFLVRTSPQYIYILKKIRSKSEVGKYGTQINACTARASFFLQSQLVEKCAGR